MDQEECEGEGGGRERGGGRWKGRVRWGMGEVREVRGFLGLMLTLDEYRSNGGSVMEKV